MVSVPASIRRRLLRISPLEADFVRRCFHWREESARLCLERAGQAFIAGYNTALQQTEPEPLGVLLNQTEPERRGFAFEGAAMALALLDLLTPWNRRRLTKFIDIEANEHVYMAHVGAGWALARLKRPVKRALSRMDPLLGWLAVDGYGFHEGYFHPQRTIEKQCYTGAITGYARRVFDQGVGRSLWFVSGGDIARITETIERFSTQRRPDLYCGVGLAATYAGGVSDEEVHHLVSKAASYRRELAQGAAFAAKARIRAGNLTDHTEAACGIICGMNATEAAAITDNALRGLSYDGAEPAYEQWRARIQSRFSGERVAG